MQLNSPTSVTGFLHIKLYDEAGNLKQEENIKNLVVTSGKNFIASRMQGTTLAVMSYMAVGTGTTAATTADTALQSELTRVGTPNFTATAGSSPNIVAYSGTFGPGVGTGAITEAGILNALTTGTLLARTVFPVINKGANDTLVIAWNITIS